MCSNTETRDTALASSFVTQFMQSNRDSTSEQPINTTLELHLPYPTNPWVLLAHIHQQTVNQVPHKVFGGVNAGNEPRHNLQPSVLGHCLHHLVIFSTLFTSGSLPSSNHSVSSLGKRDGTFMNIIKGTTTEASHNSSE